MTHTRTLVFLSLAAATAGCDAARPPDTVSRGEPDFRPPSTAPARPDPAGPDRPDRTRDGTDARPVAIQTRQPPKPDLARLRFDPATRTLELYELPGTDARWMLLSPAAARGVPVDQKYQFPAGTDLDLERVAVFYVANGRPSPAVTLQEILDAKNLRAAR